MGEQPGYPEEALRGEDENFVNQRTADWILYQLGPEYRQIALENVPNLKGRFSIPHPVWDKAVVRLADQTDHLTLGINLEQLLVASADFINWEQLMLFPSLENRRFLNLRVLNFRNQNRILMTSLTDVTRLEETGVKALIFTPANSMGFATIPLPTIIEGIPSILMTIRE